MYRVTLCIIILCAMHGAFATNARLADTEPCAAIRGDELAVYKNPVPYLGGRGPGDTIGTTAYDFQANGSFGARIMVDDYGQAHIDWMWQDYPGQNQPYCAWKSPSYAVS